MPYVYTGASSEPAGISSPVSLGAAIPVEHFPASGNSFASTQIMGCGIQKGHTNFYRGVQVKEAAFLPKVKLEVVVSKVP